MAVTPPAEPAPPSDADPGSGASGATGSGVKWPTEAEMEAQLEAVPGEELDEETLEPVEPEASAETGEPDPTEVPDPDLGTPPAEAGGLADLPASWQQEVRKLRDEAAEGRVETKKYRDAFDGWSEPDIQGFLEIASGIASSDTAAAEAAARRLILGGKNILEGMGIEVGDLALPDPNRPMTRSEYEAAERQRAAERKVAEETERNLAFISSTVKELGYEEGSLDHYALLRAANEFEELPLDKAFEKAHEMVQAHHKAIVDNAIAVLQGKRAKHLKTQPAVGSAPAPETREPPKTLDEAAARFMEDDYGDVLT